MNKKITYLLVVLFSYICVGCSTSEPDLYGSISGVVVDEETQEPLKGVSVTIAPQNATKITASDGVFTFKDLLPDEYNITFKKDEYESEVKKVNVQVGINTKADVVLSKLQPVLSVSVKTLDFGAEQTTLSFDISNSGKGVLEWNISENAEWLSCSETSGKTEKAKSSVVVTILRDGLDKGNYTQNIVIASNGGSDIVTIKVEVSGAEIEIMPMEVDLGEDESSVQFTLTNKGKGNISYKTEVSNNWMGLEPNAGDITTKGYVTLSVNRGSLDPGEYNGTVTFIIGAERISIPVKMTIPVKSKPVVSFDKTKDITYNTATFVGTIVEVGSSNIIRYGFCWSAEEEPTIEDNISDMGDCSAPISFEGKISDLKENTKYYVRAYAENAIGLSYSNVSTFVTAGLPTIPTVQTKDVTNISSNSAIANGTVISLGNVSKITQFGHIWGKSKELSTALASKTELGSLTDIGEYKSEVYELEPNQVYYVCSYATNEKGTAYGDVVEFNTLPADIILSTDKVTDIVHNAATCGGRISDYGGRTIKECGLCWSQSSKNVSITDKKVIGKIDKNMWSCRMEGLEKESTYYVRAYVISSDGTVFYGEIQSFNTTEEMSLVELSPVTISEIETQSVLLQSQIKDRGNCELKECGFCWSTEPSPSIEDESIKYESNGIFTVFGRKIEGLKDGTTYYVRAYAINAMGVSYSDEVNFTTKEITIPAWKSISVLNIGKTKVDASASLLSDGNTEITEMGVCWATHSDVSIFNEKKICDNGMDLSTQITGLLGTTTYYIRAYAQNSKGIAYSEEIQFTTKDTEVDVWDGVSVATSFAGGIGTESDPILIESGAQLKLLSDKGASGVSYEGIYFKLNSNINLNNKQWTPIRNFAGNFNGGGNSITDLRITNYNDDYVGLFGNMKTGSVSNLNVSGYIKTERSYVGMICGGATGDVKFENISVTGTVAGSSRVGGILGWIKRFKVASFINVINKSSVSGVGCVGGIFGGGYANYTGNVSISNCLNSGDVTGKENVGGILGTCDGGTISNVCSVAERNDGLGILADSFAEYATDAENCYWLNNVANNKGVEKGFNSYQEYNNCSYFTQKANNCPLLQLNNKDLVETLNEWVEDNGTDKYCKWEYEIVDGLAYPKMRIF